MLCGSILDSTSTVSVGKNDVILVQSSVMLNWGFDFLKQVPVKSTIIQESVEIQIPILKMQMKNKAK